MIASATACVHAHVTSDMPRGQGIHIDVAEGPARIFLLGEPRVIVGDNSFEIRPPLAFQVLVALALNKPRTVSRAEVARMLFPGVDPKERRAQLRLVLGHLRRRLDAELIESLYRESGSNVSLDETVEVDAFEVLSGEPVSVKRLTAYTKPVLVGCTSRFAEKCRGMVKNSVEASLPSALGTCSTIPDLWSVSPTLGQLRTLYPLSATICAYRVAVLTQLHLFEEAIQEITEFETEWLECYGAQDKPDLDKLVSRVKLTVEDSVE